MATLVAVALRLSTGPCRTAREREDQGEMRGVWRWQNENGLMDGNEEGVWRSPPPPPPPPPSCGGVSGIHVYEYMYEYMYMMIHVHLMFDVGGVVVVLRLHPR